VIWRIYISIGDTVTLATYAGLQLNCVMLRLRARVCELSPAVIEYISCRHSGVAQQSRYAGQFARHHSTSAMSAASPATDSEYKPIKKLLVANRGETDIVTFMFFFIIL